MYPVTLQHIWHFVCILFSSVFLSYMFWQNQLLVLEFVCCCWRLYRIRNSINSNRYIKQGKKGDKRGCHCIDANCVGSCTSNSWSCSWWSFQEGIWFFTHLKNSCLCIMHQCECEWVRSLVIQVNAKGGLSKALFDLAYARRMQAINGSWFGAWGLEKALWNLLVFKKVQAILGGRIRFILCGGAPLSGDSQRFINICLG